MTLRTALKKLLLRISLLSALIMCVVYYFLCTEQGLQLLWSYADKTLPDKIHVGSLHGNLSRHLTVKDFSYHDNGVEVVIHTMDLRWNAWDLLRRRVAIHDVDLDGVIVTIKPVRPGATQQASNWTVQDYLNWLLRLKIQRASIQHTSFHIYDADITLSGSLDDDWHLQWQAEIPDLHQLAADVRGSISTRGYVSGKRLQPQINADVALNRFVTQYFSIRSVSGKLQTSLQQSSADVGTFQVKGLNIESYQVPDFMLRTIGELRDRSYQLQAKAILSPVNDVTAQFTLPGITKELTVDQPFTASAKVNVKDFSQFNILFRDVPQVRSFAGHVTGEFTGSGSILHPIFDGGLQAQRGSVFVPAANMPLTDINLKTHYHTGQQVTINGTFTAGKGRASANGTFGIEESSLPLVLRIRGENVNIYNSREYKITITPDVLLSYKDNDLLLGGKILIPNAEITPRDFRQTATLPSDVVIVNQRSVMNTVPTNVTLQLQVVLGERVLLQYRDLKTKLQGSVNIFGAEGKPMTATGELRIADGTYRAYGRTLNIEQGRLIYAGNLLVNPGISLRASRTIKTSGISESSQFDTSEIKAVYTGAGTITVGIAVSGFIDKPRITLFSDVSGLSQGDILSYLLFGYPQSQATSASSLALLNIASDMYGGPVKTNPVDNLQNVLGLTELSIGSTEYLQPPDPTNSNSNLTSKTATTVNIGRDLGHKLSLHYSVGLFQQIQVFSLRYQINKHLAIQTETSTLENGGDLLYQLESSH